jgi:hypothetical protein
VAKGSGRRDEAAERRRTTAGGLRVGWVSVLLFREGGMWVISGGGQMVG